MTFIFPPVLFANHLLSPHRMSSFKNAFKGRAHKERSQVSTRKKLGILEKNKDYKLRAVNFHRKQEKLNVLREKAEFRNPNEFHMMMIHGKQKVL
jgi:U3 small nucleolar RNA-associated protein 11